MKFKVGDIIKGLPENGYGWTTEKMTKAEVISVREKSREMKIKVLDHIDKSHIKSEVWVNNDSSKFRLVCSKKPTKGELLSMPIGTKITTDLKENNVFTKYSNEYFRNINCDCLANYDIDEDLTINDEAYGTKIIKIEQPEYDTIYDTSSEVKEMTVAEIEKALGYPVKIVKEED